jgi:hypothetical protein
MSPEWLIVAGGEKLESPAPLCERRITDRVGSVLSHVTYIAPLNGLAAEVSIVM